MSAAGASAHILLAEDDRIDAKAFLRAVADGDRACRVSIARDGVEAWALLTATGAPADAGRPDIVVLDINMPRMNGIELLRRIRADAALRDLVVFVLTTSDDDRDRIEACELEVAGYLLKSEMSAGWRRALARVAAGPVPTTYPAGAAATGAAANATALSRGSR